MQNTSGFGGFGEMIQRACTAMTPKKFIFGQGYVPPGPGWVSGSSKTIGQQIQSNNTPMLFLSTLGLTGTVLWPMKPVTAIQTAGVAGAITIGSILFNTNQDDTLSWIITSIGHVAAGATLGAVIQTFI